MRLKLTNVRVAFLTVFEPKTVNGEGKPAYSAVFIIPPDHKDVPALRAALHTAAAEKWGTKGAHVLAELLKKERVCFVEGPKRNATGEPYDGFEGMYYLSTRTKSRPTVIDRDRSPLTEADGRPYSGCYVNASVEMWPQDNEFGKRINCQLRGVQFVADGDAFGGGAPASVDEFDELGVEDANPLF